MLSINQCRKYLDNRYTDEEVKKIRDSLYQLSDVLVKKYLNKKEHMVALEKSLTGDL